MLNRIKLSVSIIAFLMMLGGCSAFTSHYNEVRQQNFTKLKAIQDQFLDDWTYAKDKRWDERKVVDYCDNGNLTFREAFEYAKANDKNDKTGQRAVNVLWDEFKGNCALSLKRRKLFSTYFTKEVKKLIDANYNYAIAGELSRVKSKQ